MLAAVIGGAWTLWDRTQHDPWLRLLARTRKRLAKAGIASTPASSPRQLASLVLARYGERGQALHDWLMQLEAQRYARAPHASVAPAGHIGSTPAQTQLQQLRQQFGRLSWPA